MASEVAEWPGPMSPEASLAAMHVGPGFTVELAAAEPLIVDPIAIAWGADNKLWVVQMGDYPSGSKQNEPAGQIRYLEDTNGDDRYDRATVFLDGLAFPTGVAPWRKGVLVACPPDLFYAEDTDGDGRADRRETLYTGFGEENQQHRMNGLKWGMDGWLYCANGDSGGKIRCLKTGAEVDISGRDFRIKPDEGLLEAQSGKTQFGRSRDDWDHWFGCTNSNPMFQFVLSEHYLRRNPFAAPPDGRVNVSITPGSAPVFPRSRTLTRFNDLQAANRFTSACGVIVYRDELLGDAFEGNSFVCEPVHNLVHREVMTRDGLVFTSRRADDEQRREFLASSDNWFRPTSVAAGPDGALWIVDMYRQTIEHPKWIPESWLQRLDVRAGYDMGRIYRVFSANRKPRTMPRLDTLATPALVESLDSPSGWQRDTVQQLLVWRRDPAAVPLLEELATSSPRPICRAQALCTLALVDALKPQQLAKALGDAHPGVRREAVRLCEGLCDRSPQLVNNLLAIEGDRDEDVRLQWAYTLGEVRDARAADALARLALAKHDDRFMMAAVVSSVGAQNVGRMIEYVLDHSNQPPPSSVIDPLVTVAASIPNSGNLDAVVARLTASTEAPSTWRFSALAVFIDACQRRGTTVDQLAKTFPAIVTVMQAARTMAEAQATPKSDRIEAMRLLGRRPHERSADIELLANLIAPQTAGDVQSAAVVALGRTHDERAAQVLLNKWSACG
ncbi:MAG TPA: PVC-type heme-binding CxxCH protein, partial [Pirellulales bacterium]|nr:PVC-type heme-binding CxxCH protein [Pirellulales bacterium]